MRKGKMQPPKEKPVTSLFHQVPEKTKILYQGQELIKFGPKKAMSPSGKVTLISDNTTVTLLKD